eukprot:4026516-Pyramimonas_sp.AAC.1
MPLVAETDGNAGALARSAPPSVPVNDTCMRHMGRVTDGALSGFSLRTHARHVGEISVHAASAGRGG